MQRFVRQLLVAYQRFISWDHQWRWVLGGMRVCRYYPSCSDYMRAAIERFGVMRGALLGLRRLLRCAPWSDGGIDDVPAG